MLGLNGVKLTSMVDLKKLSVSFTKHGAHKLALLLRKHGKDDLLSNVSGVESDVNIDLAQAEKNLSRKAEKRAEKRGRR